MGGHACGEHGVEQAGLVSAGGLTDDEALGAPSTGEASQVRQSIGDGACLAGGGVEDGDGSLADISSDEARRLRGNGVHAGCILKRLGIVCGRPLASGEARSTHQATARERTGEPDDVGRRARLRDARPARAVIRVATRITAPPLQDAHPSYLRAKRQLRAERSNPVLPLRQSTGD